MFDSLVFKLTLVIANYYFIYTPTYRQMCVYFYMYYTYLISYSSILSIGAVEYTDCLSAIG